MPLTGRDFNLPTWQPKQARVGPTLLEANQRFAQQLSAVRDELMLKAWPETSRSGLKLNKVGPSTVELTAGSHVEASGKVWSWPTQTVALPGGLTSPVYYLCANLQGELGWQVRVPKSTLTVLGYVLLDEALTGIASLRAISAQSWLEYNAEGQLLRAYEGLHDWVSREEYYEYDEQGRIRQITAFEAEKTHINRYGFDAQNRLISVRRSTTRTEPFLLNGLYRMSGALFWRGTV